MRRIKRRIMKSTTAAGVALAAVMTAGTAFGAASPVNTFAEEVQTESSAADTANEGDVTEETSVSNTENSEESDASADKQDINTYSDSNSSAAEYSDSVTSGSYNQDSPAQTKDEAKSVSNDVSTTQDTQAATSSYQENVKADVQSATATYTVTFENNGHGEVPDSVNVKSGQTLAQAIGYDGKQLEPAVKLIDGYKYDGSGSSFGIYADKTCTQEFDVYNTPITENTTLFIKWIPVITYTVTYNGNGKAENVVKVLSEGSEISANAPNFYDGYSRYDDKDFYFDGWYEEPDCINAVDYRDVVNANITVYAKWVEKEYTVTFDANGHGTAPESKKVAAGGAVYENMANVEGYVFDGWYLDKAGTQKYNEDTINADTILYAKWRAAQTCKITFDNQGYGDMLEDKYIEKGEKLYTNTTDYENNEDYKFYGWFLDQECTTKAIGVSVNEDTTLYACWRKEGDTVTLSFDAGGKTENPESIFGFTIGYDFLSVDWPHLPDVKGYRFTGWIDKNGEELFWGTRVYSDTTFYAVWESEDNYKVTFELNGHGEEIEDEYTTTISERMDRPLDKSKEYTFDGWYEDEALTQRLTGEKSISKDTALYAKWIPYKTVSVKFDMNGHGSQLDSIEKEYGDRVESYDLPELYVENGYDFKGWFKDKACTIEYDSDSLYEDITLYAKWEPVTNTHKVTFDTGGIAAAPDPIVVADAQTLYFYSDELPLPSSVQEGYKFDRWETKSGSISSVTVNEDIILSAVWKTEIETINIMVEPPIVGTEADYRVNYVFKATVPESAGYKVGTDYENMSGGGVFVNGEWISNDNKSNNIKFECEEDYEYILYLYSYNYSFSDNLKAIVNGEEAEVIEINDNIERCIVKSSFHLSHDWSEWETTKEPTATEEGSRQRVCQNDPEHIEVQSIPKLSSSVPADYTNVDEQISKIPDLSFYTDESVAVLNKAVADVVRGKTGEEQSIVDGYAKAIKEAIEGLVLKPVDNPIRYFDTEGDGASYTLGSNQALNFVFKRSENDDVTYSHFTGVEVDDKLLGADNYTATAGSVNVELKPEYVETLAVGEHSLTALFDDGNNVKVGFTVNPSSAGVDQWSTPADKGPSPTDNYSTNRMNL